MYRSASLAISLRYKIMLENAFYMIFLKISVMLFALLSYPYLFQTLGAEKLGLVIYAASITAFSRVLIKFGFELSALRSASEVADDTHQLCRIFTSVLIIQSFNFGLIIILLVLFLNYSASMQEIKYLLYFSLLMPLSDIFMMTWLYQAIQKMKFISILNSLAGLLNLIGIFIFINKPDNFIYVPLVQGISFLLCAILASSIILHQRIAYFTSVSMSEIAGHFKASLVLFVSRLGAAFNDQFTVILIANLAGPAAVTYFDISKKIIEVFKIPNILINTVVFPYIAKVRDLKFVNRVFFLLIILAFFLTLGAMKFHPILMNFLAGEKINDEASHIFLLLSPLIILTAITYFSGTSILVAFHYTYNFNMSILLTSLIYISTNITVILFDRSNIYSIIICLLLSEVFLSIYRLRTCIKLNLINVKHLR